MTRVNDPAWLCYRADRARIKADEAEAAAVELERKAVLALQEFERRFEESRKQAATA